MSLVRHESIQDAQAALVEALAGVIEGTPGEIRLAFGGGRTPEGSYVGLKQRLSGREDVAGRMKVFVTDDIVETSANRRMIETAFCGPLGIPCIAPTDSDLLAAAGESGGSPLFHAVVLGLGHDGHTAALFSEADRESGDVVLRTTSPTGEPRATLGLAALGQAERIFILASGEEKAEAVQGLFSGAETSGGVVARWPQTTCLVDSDAARLIDQELRA